MNMLRWRQCQIWAFLGTQGLQIWLECDCMPALIICKFDEDPLKTERANLEIECFHYKSMGENPHSVACNYEVIKWILPKFELLRDFMHVHNICKFDEIPIRNKGAIMSTFFSGE